MAATKKTASTKTGTDVKVVKELIEMMSTNDVVELEIVDGENKIYLRRPSSEMPQQIMTQAPMVQQAPIMTTPAATAPSVAPATATAAVDDGLATVESPIVGTYYTAPSPDADPFVKVGDRVSAETTVCIIEAMKVMNEIKAEISGTIEKILVSNGQAVEFGQPLFKVKAD